MRELLSTLVEKHFPDSIRTCSQYFSLLLEYANMVRTGRSSTPTWYVPGHGSTRSQLFMRKFDQLL